MNPPAPATIRVAGRVLVIDSVGCVLLLRHRTEDGFVWAAPGGGCERGEKPAQAARRELAEECGIDIDLPANSDATHTECRRWRFDGVAYDQTDHYFVVRVAARPPVHTDRRTAPEEANVLDHRWFSVDDIDSCETRFEPDALTTLLAGYR
jgi:8-oxo-dGTP pyrophosphatase MutT (NUDIX family)